MPAKSKAQQRFMGMVYQCKKTGKGCKGAVKKAADSISTKDAKKLASTKHRGLPQNVAEQVTFKQFLLAEVHNLPELIQVAYKKSDKTRVDFINKLKELSGFTLSAGHIRRMMRDDPEFVNLDFVD